MYLVLPEKTLFGVARKQQIPPVHILINYLIMKEVRDLFLFLCGQWGCLFNYFYT